MADVKKLSKKIAAEIDAYGKACNDIAKMQSELPKYQQIMKSGDPSKMGDAAVKFSKLTAKIAAQHKKIVELQKKMNATSAEMAKATKGM
ncbi:hypothetical protein [Ruegeria jejuensis]|uniref:hypothetical protein n=1 Tax=Ruegeria jejuensis TaxID=3233338 RepID=UPI00355B81CB